MKPLLALLLVGMCGCRLSDDKLIEKRDYCAKHGMDMKVERDIYGRINDAWCEPAAPDAR